MPDLPPQPDLGRLRRQAEELLRAARAGDAAALARIGAAGDAPAPASAQLAVAREYGFASWPKLATEVVRRETLDSGDATRLRALLAAQPDLAVTRMEHWRDHPRGASPLGYVALLRYDTSRGVWRDVAGTDLLARALLEAGAPVDGAPGERETPLITAASYGDAAVARVLVEAGADIDARAAPDAGGVPGATALRHAAVFGMTAVVDVLVAAGAAIGGIEEAAAAGDVRRHLDATTPLQARIRALVMAADHERLAVIDELLQAATPIDADDETWGRQALRVAARNGRIRSVERLLARGADPDVRDAERGWTALQWCRAGRGQVADPSAHDRVAALLQPPAAAG